MRFVVVEFVRWVVVEFVRCAAVEFVRTLLMGRGRGGAGSNVLYGENSWSVFACAFTFHSSAPWERMPDLLFFFLSFSPSCSRSPSFRIHIADRKRNHELFFTPFLPRKLGLYPIPVSLV